MMFATALHAGEEIKHRFLAYDEGRAQLHYVNQHSPDKDWKLQLSKTLRDFQVIGGDKVIVAQPFGYSVYNLATRESVKDVKVPEFDGGISARRRAHGETVLGANVEGGVCVVELDKENKVVRKMTVPGIRTLRMIRLASDGNVLLAEEAGLTEVAFDSQAPEGGKIIKRISLPNGRNAFMALKKDDGSYLLSGGFAKALFAFAPDGKLRQTFALKGPPEGSGPLFFAGFQLLKNGNLVLCNWTGHGAKDSSKGWQLVEFAPDGTLVWHWHNAEQAGTLINIVILDDLNENQFLDDSSGEMKTVPTK